MLEYMRLTVPAFCKSDVGTREIEAIFRRRYPDLWKTIEREIVATSFLVALHCYCFLEKK